MSGCQKLCPATLDANQVMLKTQDLPAQVPRRLLHTRVRTPSRHGRDTDFGLAIYNSFDRKVNVSSCARHGAKTSSFLHLVTSKGVDS